MQWIDRCLHLCTTGIYPLLCLALLLALPAIILLLFPGREKNRAAPVIRRITLEDLSQLWESEAKREKREKRLIHISRLSPLWRPAEAAEPQVPPPELHNPRAAAFLTTLLQLPWFARFPAQKSVCCHILNLLDQEGECPSVVNLKGDVEGNWDENTYQLLGRTTLLDHTLNVAEQAIELLADEETGHVIPDTLIAALGHDLGKLASVRGYLYSLGEHPLAAGRPLAAIPGFNELKRKEEILQAIKLHHKMPRGLLGKTLKLADQKARQKELEQAVATLPQKKEPDRQPRPKTTDSAAPTGNNPAQKAQADIYDTQLPQPQKREKPEESDISAWFDCQQFLAELKPAINHMEGRKFRAFSMSEGYIYFQTKVLEEAIRTIAGQAGNMAITTMADRDNSMRGVLLAVVNLLRREDGIIADELIKKDFFGGYFTVTRRIGRPMKGYYTPFHAEAFGSIAEMEQGKSQILKDITSVSPYTDKQP